MIKKLSDDNILSDEQSPVDLTEASAWYSVSKDGFYIGESNEWSTDVYNFSTDKFARSYTMVREYERLSGLKVGQKIEYISGRVRFRYRGWGPTEWVTLYGAEPITVEKFLIDDNKPVFQHTTSHGYKYYFILADYIKYETSNTGPQRLEHVAG
jgi:hypothetical protein